MLQQTSILAFKNLKNMGFKQRRCYDVIERLQAACNQEIAKELGWEINRVTPRVMELREFGLVEEAYRDKYPPTNKTVIYWRVK